MAELDVTYRCNCRCLMCSRWKNSHPGELSLEEYRDLADVFDRMGVFLISIAGGEPLLREDIFAIISAFTERGMAVNLCTNGILMDSFIEPLCSTGLSCVTVSVDGASAQSHDEIRGVPGSYARIRGALQSIMKRPGHKRPLVRTRMTISNRNLKEVGFFFRQWEGLVDDVLLQPVHLCSDSYYTGPVKEDFGIDPLMLAGQLKGSSLERSVYLKRLVENLLINGGFPKQHCYAGVLMVRIDPWGRVFPCLEQHVQVGSVRERDFSSIWKGDVFNQERKRIESGGECRCWYNNTAMIGHFGKWIRHTTARGIRASLRGAAPSLPIPLPGQFLVPRDKPGGQR